MCKSRPKAWYILYILRFAAFCFLHVSSSKDTFKLWNGLAWHIKMRMWLMVWHTRPWSHLDGHSPENSKMLNETLLVLGKMCLAWGFTRKGWNQGSKQSVSAHRFPVLGFLAFRRPEDASFVACLAFFESKWVKRWQHSCWAAVFGKYVHSLGTFYVVFILQPSLVFLET